MARDIVISCDNCGKPVGVDQSEPLVRVQIIHDEVNDGKAYMGNTDGNVSHELCGDCGRKVKVAIRDAFVEGEPEDPINYAADWAGEQRNDPVDGNTYVLRYVSHDLREGYKVHVNDIFGGHTNAVSLDEWVTWEMA